MNKNNLQNAAVEGAWCPDYSGGEFWATPLVGESQEAFYARITRAWEIDRLFCSLEASCRQVAEEIGERAPERGMPSVYFAWSLADWWGTWNGFIGTLQALERLGAYNYWEHVFPEFVRRGAAAAAATAAERAAK